MAVRGVPSCRRTAPADLAAVAVFAQARQGWKTLAAGADLSSAWNAAEPDASHGMATSTDGHRFSPDTMRIAGTPGSDPGSPVLPAEPEGRAP